jgi:hypothetical protein
LTLMVVQSFEYKPWVLHLLPIWVALLISLRWGSVELKLGILPHDYLSWLSSCDQDLFIWVDCDSGNCTLVLCQCKRLLLVLIDWAELDSSIPVASLDHILASINDQEWLVKLFNAPVNLVYSALTDIGGEFWLAISSKREWSRRIHLVCSW